MTIIERIYDELEKQGLRPSALCRYAGISTAQLSTWKRRGTEPKPKYMPKIAEFLGTSIYYLTTGLPAMTGESGDVIRKAREDAGLTQQELAGKLNIAASALGDIENCSNVSVDILESVSNVLNLPLGFIFKFEGDDCVETHLSFCPVKTKLLEAFESLNAEGKNKVLSYAEDLVASGAYAPLDSVK